MEASRIFFKVFQIQLNISQNSFYMRAPFVDKGKCFEVRASLRYWFSLIYSNIFKSKVYQLCTTFLHFFQDAIQKL